MQIQMFLFLDSILKAENYSHKCSIKVNFIDKRVLTRCFFHLHWSKKQFLWIRKNLISMEERKEVAVGINLREVFYAAIKAELE
jgi:hypothetical protein